MFDFEELLQTEEYQNASPEARQEVEDLYASEFWKELSSSPDFLSLHPDEQNEYKSMFVNRFRNGSQILKQHEYDVVGGIKDVGKLLYDIPVQTKGAVGHLMNDPETSGEMSDAWIAEADARTKQRQDELSPGDRIKKVIPLPGILSENGALTRGDIQDTSQSSGFSAVAMGAGAVGGLLGSVGGPWGSAGGSLAGAGAVAYKMDKSIITNELVKATEQSLGRPLEKNELTELLARTEDARNDHALWEAGPEAIGTAISLTGIGKIFKGASEKLTKNIVTGLMMNLGGELATETPTQIGQNIAEHEMGIGQGNKMSWDAESAKQALQEVGPGVITQTGILGGGGYIAGKTAGLVKQRKPSPSEILDAPDIDTALNTFSESLADISGRMAEGVASLDQKIASIDQRIKRGNDGQTAAVTGTDTGSGIGNQPILNQGQNNAIDGLQGKPGSGVARPIEEGVANANQTQPPSSVGATIGVPEEGSAVRGVEGRGVEDGTGRAVAGEVQPDTPIGYREVGFPSTAEQAAQVFQNESTPLMQQIEDALIRKVGRPEYATVENSARMKRVADAEAAFSDSDALLPRHLATAIAKMELDLKNTDKNGVITSGSGNEQTVVGGFPSTRPDWFKNDTIKKYDKQHGTNYSTIVREGAIKTVLRKIRNGEPLKGRQNEVWQYIQTVAGELNKSDPELAANQEFSNLEKQGFEFDAPKSIAAGALKPGDEVVIQKNGVPDKLVHKGFDESGRAVLKDGVTMHVDPFDQIEIIAQKQGERVSEQEEKFLVDLVSKIREIGTTEDVTRIGKEIEPYFAQNKHLMPYKDMVVWAVNARSEALSAVKRAGGEDGNQTSIQQEGSGDNRQIRRDDGRTEGILSVKDKSGQNDGRKGGNTEGVGESSPLLGEGTSEPFNAARGDNNDAITRRGPSSGIGVRSSSTGTMLDKAGVEYAVASHPLETNTVVSNEMPVGETQESPPPSKGDGNTKEGVSKTVPVPSNQVTSTKSPWKMTLDEFVSDALNKNEYKDQYLEDEDALNSLNENSATEWRRTVEAAGKNNVLPDSVIDDYVDTFGKQTLMSTFRGEWAKGISEWEPKEVRIYDKTYRQFLADKDKHSRTLPGGKKAYHRAAVEKALSQGKPVPASVLADYQDLSTDASTSPASTKTQSIVTDKSQEIATVANQREGDERTLSGDVSSQQPATEPVTKSAPARNVNSQGESAKRGKPEYMVIFSTPIKGANGGSVQSYEWAWTGGVKFDEREGGDVEARVSDWDNAVDNPDTGRKIVHKFHIVTPSGDAETVSLESAKKILGIEGNLLNLVRYERNRQIIKEINELRNKVERGFDKKTKGIDPYSGRETTYHSAWGLPGGKDAAAEFNSMRGTLKEFSSYFMDNGKVSDRKISILFKKHGERIYKHLDNLRVISNKLDDTVKRIKSNAPRIDERIETPPQEVANEEGKGLRKEVGKKGVKMSESSGKKADMRSIKEIDKEYLAAIESGDRTTAQLALNEAYGIEIKDSSFDRGDSIHSPAGPSYGSPAWDVTLGGMYPDDVYSLNGLRYYGTGEDRMDREAYSILQRLKGHPGHQVRVYRAVEKDTKGGIKPGDWVTTVRSYAKEHGESNIRDGYKIVSKLVSAKDIYTSGDSWLEWGYHPQVLFPRLIVRDTDGSIIPPSKRIAVRAKKSQTPATSKSQSSDLTPSQRRTLSSLTSTGKVKMVSREEAAAVLEKYGVKDAKFMVAWHGSPHDHDGFKTKKIGTGEGAQAYGYGLYFAGAKEVAEHYQKGLSGRPAYKYGGKVYAGNLNDLYYSAINKVVKNGKDDAVGYFESMATYEEDSTRRAEYAAVLDFVKKIDETKIEQVQNPGRIYQVELAPAEDEYLLWDRPLSEQSEKVKAALEKGGVSILSNTDKRIMGGTLNRPNLSYSESDTGKFLYEDFAGGDKDFQRETSEWFHSLGIRGIKYLDGSSRNKPLRDIKREFLNELPEDAALDDIEELIGTGKFSPKNETILKALIEDDWLGFDYPAQAISAALSKDLSNYDPSPALTKAVQDAQDGGTFNFVIFNDTDVSIIAKYSDDAGNIQGFALPDGTTYLLPDNIEKGRIWNVIRHEVGVHVSRALQSNKSFRGILRSIEKRKDEQSKTGDAIRDAMSRVPADTNPEYRTEEILAYLAEGSPNIGIVRQFIALVKNVLYKLGFDPKIFTSEDLAALAEIAVRWNGEKAGATEVLKSVAAKFKTVDTDMLKSDAFRRWFGRSVLRNPKTSQPYVFYHNSPARFYEFDLGKVGSNTGHGSAGLGFFFGVRANPRYGQQKMKVFLRMEKPYRMGLEESQQFDTVDKAVAFREKLQKQGYDGIVMDFREVGGNPYIVVFDPNQVNSAEVNTGEFSTVNNDIRLSMSQMTPKERRNKAQSDLVASKKRIPKIDETINFIRFGNIVEKSKNWAEGNTEQGMSVYSLSGDGAAEQTIRTEFSENKSAFIGKGRVVGYGSDGEPLVADVGDIRKATPAEIDRADYYGMGKKKWLEYLDNAEKDNLNTSPQFQPVDINSPEFKAWFENSMMKRNGKPAKFYHGTKEIIDEFKSAYGDGILFFAQDPAFASRWALNKPKDAPRNFKWSDEDARLSKKFWDEYGRKFDGDSLTEDQRKEAEEMLLKRPPDKYDLKDTADSAVMPVYLNVTKPFIPHEHFNIVADLIDKSIHEQARNGAWLPYENERVIRRIRMQGFDGIFLKEGGYETAPKSILDYSTVGVFDSTQAKSVISNIGTYSPTDPRIRYSKKYGEPESIVPTDDNPIVTNIKGTHFTGIYDDPDFVKQIQQGVKVDLIREPENETDYDAIRVEFNGRKIGYVSRIKAPQLTDLMDDKIALTATIKTVKLGDKPVFTIEIPKPADMNDMQLRSWEDAKAIEGRHKDGRSWRRIAEKAMVETDENFSDDLEEAMKDVLENGPKEKNIVKRITKFVSGLKHDKLNHFFSVLTLQQLDDVYGRYFSPVRRFREAAKGLSAKTNEMLQEADRLHQRWSKLNKKTAADMADVMFKATTLQFDPDGVEEDEIAKMETRLQEKRDALKAARESKMMPTNKAQAVKKFIREIAIARKELTDAQELIPMFKALPKEAQEIYREVRGMYQKRYEQLQEALISQIEKTTTGKGKRQTIAALRLEFEKQIEQGPYFPLSRFGDHVVIVKKKDANGETNDYAVKTFERFANAEEFAQGMRNKGFDVTLKRSKEYKPGQEPPHTFATQVLNIVNQAEIPADQRRQIMDEVNQAMIKVMPDLSYRKHFAHRKGVKGFSQDAQRAFASHMLHAAKHIAKVEFGTDLNQAIKSMEHGAFSHDEKSAAVEGALRNELVKRYDYMMNANVHPAAQVLTSLGFAWNIGPSLASAVVNLTQTPLVAYPLMAAKFGSWSKSASALMKAAKDYTKGEMTWESGISIEEAKFLTEDERKMFSILIKDGTIDVSQAHDLAQAASTDYLSLSEKGGNLHKFAKAMKVISAPFHYAEVANRQITALAVYRMAAPEAGHDVAVNMAREIVEKGHFDYSGENRARIMQGNLARVALLFKQYAQNMTFRLARDFQMMLKRHDVTGQEKKEARARFFGIIGGHFMVAGALGLPVVGMFGQAVGAMMALLGDDDEPWDYKTELRNFLADTFGVKGGEMIAHGPARILPVDLSTRMSLSDLWWRSDERGLEGRELFNHFMMNILGPTAGNASAMFTGASMMAEGEIWKGVEMMLPKVVKDVGKSIRYAQEGVTNKQRDILLDELDGYELAGQLLGFTPSRVSEMYEGKTAIKGMESALQERRTRLKNMYIRAYEKKDKEGMDKAWEKIAKWNDTHAGVKPLRITKKDIMRSYKRRKMYRERTKQGVYLAKTREYLREKGDFVNTEQ